MEKIYPPGKIEKKWRLEWKAGGALSQTKGPGESPYFILLPPTGPGDGNFPLQHTLAFTIADLIARRKGMQGHEVFMLTVPGEPGVFPGGRRETRYPEEALGLSFPPDCVKESSGELWNRDIAGLFVDLYRSGLIYPRRGTDKGGPGVEEDGGKWKSGEQPSWFLNIRKLKQVSGKFKEGEISFTPDTYNERFSGWEPGTRDWLVSEPGGAGPPLPVNICRDCGHMTVEIAAPTACPGCGSGAAGPAGAAAAPWFTAALGPVVWAKQAARGSEPAGRCPRGMVVTGRGTAFRWVLRMILLGAYLLGEVPFGEVFFCGAAKGTAGGSFPGLLAQGNSYGADVLRFALVSRAAAYEDVVPDAPGMAQGVKAGRRFTLKLWNAARLVLEHPPPDDTGDIDPGAINDADRWILHALNATIEKINQYMDDYNTYAAAVLLYRFFRHRYCNWYLELVKTSLHNGETRKVMKYTLLRFIKLLHPFMPFITEEIFHRLTGKKGAGFLLDEEYPVLDTGLTFPKVFGDMQILKKVVAAVRKIRSENGIAPNRTLMVRLKTESAKEKKVLRKHLEYFEFLAKSSGTEFADNFKGCPGGFNGSCLNWEILLPLEGEQVRLKESARLQGELEGLGAKIKELESRLSDTGFLGGAGPALVTRLKKDLMAAIDRRGRIREAINGLK